MNTISIIVDPSHGDWVLGGIMRDIHCAAISNFEAPVALGSPKPIKSLFSWLRQCKSIGDKPYVLFSSLTPLENYSRFPIKSRTQKIGLWFTHNEFTFTRSQIKVLNLCNVIYVHSQSIKESLEPLTRASIVVVIGAIDPKRFSRPSLPGEMIAWVGTSVQRKRPKLFLEVVSKNPDLNFRLLGRNWMNSEFWNLVGTLKNLEYIEVSGALSSSDFDGCSILLVTSEIEGGPMPIMEGLASGVFPVGTNTGFLKDLQEIAGLPRSFIHPATDRISAALRSQLNDVSRVSPTSREKILNLDFERLARIIQENLVEGTK